MAYRDYLGLLLPRKIKNSEVLDIVNTEKGQANGIASLNNSGQVPSSQLPSYVDDILEFDEFNDFPLTGQTGKIYLDKDENKIYRWSGSQYIEISSGGASYQYIADGTSQSVLLGRIDKNIASGQYSVAEGNATTASGENSHAEGRQTKASGQASHAEGLYAFAYGVNSHAEGMATQAWGENSHTEGYQSLAGEENSYDYGYDAHAQGSGTQAKGGSSHAQGSNAQAVGGACHAEGNATTAGTDDSEAAHAEGSYTQAIGDASHAEGQGAIASAPQAHAEGSFTAAQGGGSHAEGNGTTASGDGAHAQGYSVYAPGLYAHAEGNATTAYGTESHAEGFLTYAYGNHSHAGGYGTVATEGQTVIGQYNATTETTPGQPTTQEAVFIIGNGSSEDNRSDAFAIKQDGTLVFANGTEITPTQFAQLKALLS